MNRRVKYTNTQKIGELLLLLFMLAFFVYFFLQWPKLPETIPSHFNFAGEIDACDSKNSLFFLPFFGLGIYLLLTLAGFLPTSAWNEPVAVTRENALYVCTLTRSLLLWIKFLLLSMFFYITLCSMFFQPLGAWFIFAVLGLLLTTVFVYIVRICRGATRIAADTAAMNKEEPSGRID